MQGWGFVNLPSLLYHPYLVCILFGMPFLHPFIFLIFFKSCIIKKCSPGLGVSVPCLAQSCSLTAASGKEEQRNNKLGIYSQLCSHRYYAPIPSNLFLCPFFESLLCKHGDSLVGAVGITIHKLPSCRQHLCMWSWNQTRCHYGKAFVSCVY